VAKAFIPYSTKWGTNEIKAQMNRASFRVKSLMGRRPLQKGIVFVQKGKQGELKWN
jgi:hypothetical protein